MYVIRFLPDLNLLDIEWHDQFTAEAVAAYAADLKQRFLREGFANGYLLRIDMSRSAVQPQDALPTFREVFHDFPKARRIAIVTRSTIARLQVQREMKQPYLRIFDNAPASLDWLLEKLAA
jgi:hypothetical protein